MMNRHISSASSLLRRIWSRITSMPDQFEIDGLKRIQTNSPSIRSSTTTRFPIKPARFNNGSQAVIIHSSQPPAEANELFFAALKDLLIDRKRERRNKLTRSLLTFTMVLGPLIGYGVFIAIHTGFFTISKPPTVAIVRIEGEMSDGANASGDKVVPVIRKVCDDESVKAIVLAIDSPGGAPLEAERIYSAVETCRAKTKKPIVAVIHNLGASAAYMVALHADTIYAGKYSLVGSIGAIMSGWDAHDAVGRVGLAQRAFASGELKSMMNPWQKMSPAAEAKAQSLVNEMGAAFKLELESQRGSRLQGHVDYTAGGVWNGIEAKKIGLVDEVATIDNVVAEKWPDLVVKDYGPGTTGFPFVATTASFLRNVLTELSVPQVR